MLTDYPMVQRALAGALAGLIPGLAGAARADYMAFRSWTSYRDAAAYDWGVAAWRWFQGAVSGAVTGATVALGIDAML